MKKVVLAALAAMGMASSAFAVTAQSGIYVGALGGWSIAEKPSQSNMGATDASNKNYTAGATIGYNYAFTPNWLAGLEGSYIYFGYNDYNFDDGTDAKLKNSGFQLMATGTYLMDNGFNVFGKLGAIDQKTEISGSGADGSESTTKWLPAAAVGVGYMPIQNLNIALQYERTFGDNWNSNSVLNSSDTAPKPMSQNAITLGVTYNFAL